MTQFYMVKKRVVAGLLTLLSILCIGDAAWATSQALHVVGSQVQTVAGNCVVTLKGINVPSLEWSNAGEGPLGGDPQDTVNTAFTQWKCNVVRLPLCQDRWSGNAPGQSDGGAAYKAKVDTIVNLASAKDSYVVLDLHWSDAGGLGTYLGQHKMPDDNSTAFWNSVAARYANNTAVLFDLYNEPHNVTAAVWRNGGTVTESTADNAVGYAGSYHSPGLQGLLTTIRGAGANNMVLAGGLTFANDLNQVLPGSALTDTGSGQGIIYAAHIYPDTQTPWDNIVTNPAAGHPVFIGEFGTRGLGTGGTALAWSNTVLSWISAHGFSYTAWAMHPGTDPSAITNWNFNPNTWEGVPVQTALAGTTPIICGAATKTFTPTPTPNLCTNGCNYSWGFDDNSTDGFTVNAGSGTEAGTSAVASNALAHCGAFSLAVPFSATSSLYVIDPLLYQGISPAANLTGKTLSCWVYIQAPAPPSGSPSAQWCAVDGGGGYHCSSMINGIPLNTWVKLSEYYSAADNVTSIVTLDLQVFSPTQGQAGQTWSGTIYFDDICVATTVPSPTPTISPTHTITTTPGPCAGACENYWGFDDGTTQNWGLVGAPPDAGTSLQATTTKAFCGAYSISIPFHATDANWRINPLLWAGISPAKDCTNKILSTWVYLSATASPLGLPQAQFFGYNAGGQGYYQWLGYVPLNQWVRLSADLGPAAVDVITLSLEIWSPTKNDATGKTWDGIAYFDSICISSIFTPTPTPPASFTRTASTTAAPTHSTTASGTSTPTASPSAPPSLTASPSASPSRTATPTLANTPVDTATSSASTTRSATPSSTGSSTATVTRTASGTATPSRSPTPTASPTWTKTVTPSTTPMASSTATLTASPSDSPTFTGSGTITPTPSATASGSPSPSATPTSTNILLSWTITPTSTSSLTRTVTSTVTSTRSATPTSTHTSSATLSNTPTAPRSPAPTSTASFTATSTGSSTPTPSATSTSTRIPSATLSQTPSPTMTATGTRTSSASPTASATLTSTPTWTPTRTWTYTTNRTYTPSVTLTGTPTAKLTATGTVTLSPTPTRSPTLTWSYTANRTFTPSATMQPSNIPTSTVTPVPSSPSTASPTLTGTPVPASPTLENTVGQGGIRVVPMPNPQSGSGISLMIWTAGPVSSLSLKIYGKAMMFVAEKELEPGNAGWQFYRIEDLSLGNGVYYLVASAVGENGKKLKSKPTKMLILR